MKKLLLLLASTTLMMSADNAAAEKAVRAAHDAFNTAVRAGDGAKMNALLGDELIYGHSTAKLETKQECVAALVKSKSNFEILPGSTVQVYGNAAVWTGKMTAHNMTNGKAVDVPLHMVQVWVKRGGRWVMVTRHTTRLPAAP